ncbi:MAG: SCO family protein, partial [Burkholderiaceae bacterium]|nr:SCO family protein [Burkholderiaceae bacterium]
MGAVAVVAVGALLLSACADDGPPFVGIDVTGANYANAFTLTDHNGVERSLGDFAGKVVVIFFGYTQCPDVCPSSMTEMAEAKRLLGADGERFQGLFLSVDPERDTPEIMRAYVSHFDDSFLALYTQPGALQQLAKDFKIYFKKVPGPTPTSYTMDHSAGSYVYDTTGQLRLYNRYNT